MVNDYTVGDKWSTRPQDVKAIEARARREAFEEAEKWCAMKSWEHAQQWSPIGSGDLEEGEIHRRIEMEFDAAEEHFRARAAKEVIMNVQRHDVGALLLIADGYDKALVEEVIREEGMLLIYDPTPNIHEIGRRFFLDYPEGDSARFRVALYRRPSSVDQRPPYSLQHACVNMTLHATFEGFVERMVAWFRAMEPSWNVNGLKIEPAKEEEADDENIQHPRLDRQIAI